MKVIGDEYYCKKFTQELPHHPDKILQRKEEIESFPAVVSVRRMAEMKTHHETSELKSCNTRLIVLVQRKGYIGRVAGNLGIVFQPNMETLVELLNCYLFAIVNYNRVGEVFSSASLSLQYTDCDIIVLCVRRIGC